MLPNDNCPFIDQYEEGDTLFCVGCINFIRANEYDKGHNKNDAEIAFICEKDCMTPEIYYTEYEPVMPWE